jgi:hypothetical protein
LGPGLWRRLYDDCATAARQAPVLDALLAAAYSMAEQGQRRWPSASLDVPSDPAGLAHYQRLRQVRRCFSDVAYRERLAAVTADDQQAALLARARDEATALLLGPEA